MMARYPAWLLRADDDVTFAVAQHEMIEYLTEARVQRVPLANPYCDHLALWRDALVPILDFPRLLRGAGVTIQRALSIVAYQPRALRPLEYLGIWVDAPPSRIAVGDDQACDLPQAWHDVRFAPLALSCFTHDDQPVPILNLAQLAGVSLA
ncbi:MAG: hypothetical protein OEN20_04960 [Gammaproteobacteria bacterium]|nr:hypothetical protein [Gammaproteobacteria bacterium]